MGHTLTASLQRRITDANRTRALIKGLVENAGTRICGYAGMRICGYADMRVCGYAGMRICGYAGMGICGYAGTSNWFNKQISKTH